MEDTTIKLIYKNAHKNVEMLTKYVIWSVRIYIILYNIVTILSLTLYNYKHNKCGNLEDSFVQIFPAT